MSKWIRGAAIGALGAASMLAASSPSAGAAWHRYCNSVVPATTACGPSYVNVILLNRAYYLGAGSVSVCERAVEPPNGSQLSRRCSTGSANQIDSDQDLVDDYQNSNPARVTCGNNSPWDHTILCEALY